MTDNKKYIERKRISGVLPPTCPHGDEYSLLAKCIQRTAAIIGVLTVNNGIIVISMEISKRRAANDRQNQTDREFPR